MNYQVQIIDVEEQATAVVRSLTTLSELATVVPRGCGEVWAFVRSAGLAHPGRNITLYLDDKMNIEVGVEVFEAFASDGRIFASHLPAGKVATTAHIGPYDRLGEAHAALRQYCQDQSLVPAGPGWEIYGHPGQSREAPRTDIFVLLK